MSVKGQSINVTIANRVYPMTVSSMEEEEYVRKAANMINKKVQEYEQKYAVQDTQDLLAMSALKFSVEKVRLEEESSEMDTLSVNKIKELIDLVEIDL